MKKIILTTAIILTAFVGAFAQDKIATANLSVTINPLQTIQVINPNVNLNYGSTTDYKDGVKSVQANHLKIYSTGAFQVKVSATDLSATGTTLTIPASSITVKADNGTDNPLDNIGGNNAVPLPTGTAATTLFTSTLGGVDRNVNVTYTGAGLDEYINKYFSGKAETPNVYSTTVTYSIEAM